LSLPLTETPPGSLLRLERMAIFLADLQGGGAERMMVNLAAGLADKGVEVDLILANAVGPYRAEVPDTVHVVPLETGGVMRALPALARYLSRVRPQLLLTTLHHSSVVALLARWLSQTDVQLYVREANTPSKRPRTPLQPKRWLAGELIRRLYRRADGVIAVSNGVAVDVANYFGLPDGKVIVMHNPVVTDDLDRLAGLEPGHPWFGPGCPPVFLAVGRLHAQKDFPTLIRAFARIRAKRDARLVILGEGEDRDDLERLVQQLRLVGQVDLPGFVNNPFAFMSRTAVFVLSSKWEGLPGALIQAMACGCPVVATDCPSGPSEVLQNGRFGDLVPVGDEVALAEAMARTLDSPPAASMLRERSRKYSQADVVADYIEYFEGKLAR
jgi:glycosyltransferase involved in cell wall biosynthesis